MVFGPCAAAAVYKREMLEQVRGPEGYFDEGFFFFVEDVDLAWRCRRQGWTGIFSPKAVCRHFGGSSAYDFRLRQYLCYRNRLLMIQKNDGLWSYRCKILPTLLYDLPRKTYLYLANPYLHKKTGLFGRKRNREKTAFDDDQGGG